MPQSPASLASLRAEVALGAMVTAAAAAAAVATGHWTALLAPAVWAAIVGLADLPLPRRFAALAAATVLLPRYPLGLGMSVDDLIPSAAAIAGVVLLARWGFPPLPRPVAIAFGVWICFGAASAVFNGDGIAGIVRLAGPGVARPLFWLVFAWTAAAVARRAGVATLLIPIAAIGIVQAVFAIAAYTRCGEIHLGAVSQPENEAVWDSRRPLGVEQGAGTNVGEQRIRCRATGTLGQSSNFLAAFLVTTLPVAAGAAIAERRRLRRAVYAAGTLAMAAAVVLTFTRAALLAVAAALAITLLFAAPRRAVPLLIAGAVLLVAATAAVPQLRRRLSDPANDRRALWYSGMLIFADHPVFGVGFGRYLAVQRSNPKYLDTPFGVPTTTAHNGFIAVAAEGGGPQAAAVLTLTGAVLGLGWRAARRARGSPDGPLVAAAFGGACGFLVQNMTNTLLLVPAVATYFWVLGGALVGLGARERASRASPATRATSAPNATA